MNQFWIIGLINGIFIGLALGYILKFSLDNKFFKAYQKINDDYAQELKDIFEHREEIYKNEINRLHSLIGDVSAAKEATKMSDLVRAALERDGFEEIDFPNGGKK